MLYTCYFNFLKNFLRVEYHLLNEFEQLTQETF